MLRHPAGGYKIKDTLKYLPSVAMECSVTPITRTVLRVALSLRPEFVWRESAHGHAMRWILWVGDSENDFVYYNEVWTLTRKMMQVRTTSLPTILSQAEVNCTRNELALVLSRRVIPARLNIEFTWSTTSQAGPRNICKSRYVHIGRCLCRRRNTSSTSRSRSLNP